MQTIDRAFAVLGALAGQRRRLGLTEIANNVDLPKTTVLRILTSLEDLAMVERTDGQYALGPGIAALTRHASPSAALGSVARPYLAELSETYGENASVGIEEGGALLYIDTALAPGAVQVSDWTGRRVPLHADAAGLVLLSGWSERRLADYAAAPLVAPTRNTVTSAPALAARAAAIRESGHAWTYGEFSDDVNGVAAPVADEAGIIGAINVYGPAYRWPGGRDRDTVVADLLDVCARISARFAGDG